MITRIYGRLNSCAYWAMEADVPRFPISCITSPLFSQIIVQIVPQTLKPHENKTFYFPQHQTSFFSRPTYMVGFAPCTRLLKKEIPSDSKGGFELLL